MNKTAITALFFIALTTKALAEPTNIDPAKLLPPCNQSNEGMNMIIPLMEQYFECRAGSWLYATQPKDTPKLGIAFSAPPPENKKP